MIKTSVRIVNYAIATVVPTYMYINDQGICTYKTQVINLPAVDPWYVDA